MTNELADKEYWQQSWKKSNKLDKSYTKNPFKNQFDKYLPMAHSNRYALEIGCVPGIFLGHLGKNYGYIVEGIDYIEGAKNTTSKTLEKFGIENSTIYEEDFIKWQPLKKYDLTCSFGFIEHFTEVGSIIDKHVETLKSEGILILEIPNFSGLQFFLHKYLDRQNLERHNTNIMNLEFFESLSKKNNLKIKCLEYTGGLFDFWWENDKPSILQKFLFNIIRLSSFFLRQIPVSCRFTSPFIILIAQKNN